jgi:hypothetical protein
MFVTAIVLMWLVSLTDMDCILLVKIVAITTTAAFFGIIAVVAISLWRPHVD